MLGGSTPVASDTQGRENAKKMRRRKDPEGRMSLGEHLVELRNRLLISAITVVLLSVVGWFLFPWVFDAVKAPIEAAGEDSDLQALINFQGVGTGLNVKLQMSAYIGLILSAPMLLAQIWLFVMPGLHRNERKYAVGFFGSAIPLFFLGCVAGYWAVTQLVPVLMSFTPTQGSTSQIIPYNEYLNLLIKTMLAFGIAFVMPVVLVLLNFLGILRGRTMLKAWRWVIFLCFAFTAVMVPTPEPVTLIGMSAAISSLFFAAVGISIWNDRRRDKLAGDEDLADDEASRIDDEVEPIDAPERGEKDRRWAGSGWACCRIRPPPWAPRTASAGRSPTCCAWPGSRSWTCPVPPRAWPGPGPWRCATPSRRWWWSEGTAPSPWARRSWPAHRCGWVSSRPDAATTSPAAWAFPTTTPRRPPASSCTPCPARW